MSEVLAPLTMTEKRHLAFTVKEYLDHLLHVSSKTVYETTAGGAVTRPEALCYRSGLYNRYCVARRRWETYSRLQEEERFTMISRPHFRNFSKKIV